MACISSNQSWHDVFPLRNLLLPLQALIVGLGAVFFYHLGAHAEFRWRIPDTARVFPVHGMCGIWGLLCTGLFGRPSLIRQTYENICGCQQLTLPDSVDSRSLLFAFQVRRRSATKRHNESTDNLSHILY